MRRVLVIMFFTLLHALSAATAGASDPSLTTQISEGVASREQGDLMRSVEILSEAQKQAGTDTERARVCAELGVSLLQMQQLDQAERVLKQAYDLHTGLERGRDALHLGNLALHRKQPLAAKSYYEEAIRLAGSDAPLRLSASLNHARMQSSSKRLAQLTPLAAEVANIADPETRARLQINLASLAQSAGEVELAYRNLEAARKTLIPRGSSRLLVETLDALAQLYEDQERPSDAALLNAEGIAHVGKLDSRAGAESRVSLNWRQGRLLKHAGQLENALAAYQRAADHLESIRQALPIEYEDGRSTYSATIEPLYLGLTELLLGLADSQPQAVRSAYLRKARDVIELTRQAEMQDFLGDRCSVESIEGSNAAMKLPPGTVVLYTVLLPDHMELLIETPRGFNRKRVEVSSNALRTKANVFAEQLRVGDVDYHANARQLYDWLIRPIEDALATHKTGTLVVVPDGALRLVAMAALNDGRQFLIEKYALASATGLSMTQTDAPSQGKIQSLIAGLSEPGPVVDKLAQQSIRNMLTPDSNRNLNRRGIAETLTSLRSVEREIQKFEITENGRPKPLASEASTRAPVPADASATLRQALFLPGVKDEVLALGNTLSGKILLNESFTLKDFSREAEGGEYRILHIASHGVFGGSSESSFILTYDDLLTLDGLQSLLKSDSFRKNPIEILGLSACQTAEGNERAPLGISGAAIKARARSVLGTLWPVEDNAARAFMAQFYMGLTKQHLNKAEAQRQAQIALINDPKTNHPLFWAPFILIGNWQ